DLTTFHTKYGNFKFKVMPFGVRNGPPTFQRYVNTILQDQLDRTNCAFADDITIYSDTPEEHECHVREAMRTLMDAGLFADIEKSEFFTDKIDLLGYMVSTDGVSIHPRQYEPVRTWSVPKCMKDVQRFLGKCGFSRQFIKDYGKIARPLQKLVGKD